VNHPCGNGEGSRMLVTCALPEESSDRIPARNMAGRHRLRDPRRPAASHPSPQDLGKNFVMRRIR